MGKLKKLIYLHKKKNHIEKLIHKGCITCNYDDWNTIYFKEELQNIEKEIKELKGRRKLKWIFIQKLIKTLIFY